MKLAAQQNLKKKDQLQSYSKDKNFKNTAGIFFNILKLASMKQKLNFATW